MRLNLNVLNMHSAGGYKIRHSLSEEQNEELARQQHAWQFPNSSPVGIPGIPTYECSPRVCLKFFSVPSISQKPPDSQPYRDHKTKA